MEFLDHRPSIVCTTCSEANDEGACLQDRQPKRERVSSHSAKSRRAQDSMQERDRQCLAEISIMAAASQLKGPCLLLWRNFSPYDPLESIIDAALPKDHQVIRISHAMFPWHSSSARRPSSGSKITDDASGQWSATACKH